MVSAKTDVFPNIMNLRIQESAANTFTEKEYSTPVISGIGTKPIVMEIHKIFTLIGQADLEAEQSNTLTGQISKHTQTDLLLWSNIDCVLQVFDVVKNVGARTNETSGTYQKWNAVQEFDFQVGEKKKGLLYPYPNIFISVKGVGNAAVKQFEAKILYTMTEISASELAQLLSETSS